MTSALDAAVARFDSLALDDSTRQLHTCCGARAWADGMAHARPFGTAEAMLSAADRIWAELAEADWLEAFACHPRIGAGSSDTQTARERSWSEQEQAGTNAAQADVMEALAAVNRDYDARFGYVFLVCATGKTAEEMLQLAQQRLLNDDAAELAVAAEEHRQITRLRIRKLLESL